MTWHEYLGWWIKTGELLLPVVILVLLLFGLITWFGKHI
jgi:hypothetical protein